MISWTPWPGNGYAWVRPQQVFISLALFFSLKFELFLSHKSSTILALCCYLFKTLILDHGVKEIHTKHQKTLFLVWSQPVANYSSIFSAEDITILLTEDRRGRPDGLTQIHQSLVKDSSILIKAISSCLISQGQWTTYALPIKHTHTHTHFCLTHTKTLLSQLS